MNNKSLQALVFSRLQSRQYLKNIRYPSFDDVDRSGTSSEILHSVMDTTLARYQDTGSAVAATYMYMYGCYGAQMQITKEVSELLMASDFDPATVFDSIPFVAPSMEMYFEDPRLPTVLLTKIDDNLKRLVPDVNLFGERSISCYFQTAEAYTLLTFTEKEATEFLTKPSEEQLMRLGGGISELPGKEDALDETVVASFLTGLCLKVLAFAAVPRFAPAKVSKKQMTFGGKPGVANRPTRPTLQVVYLPKVIQVTQSEESCRSHDFRGRRGHIRHFKHERFVNKKGTWILVEPVKDPFTGQYPLTSVKYKVRNPTT